MDVRDQGCVVPCRPKFSGNLSQAFCVSLARSCDANQFAPCFNHSDALRHRARHIHGVGCGHGLHSDGLVSAQTQGADLHLSGGAALVIEGVGAVGFLCHRSGSDVKITDGKGGCCPKGPRTFEAHAYPASQTHNLPPAIVVGGVAYGDRSRIVRLLTEGAWRGAVVGPQRRQVQGVVASDGHCGGGGFAPTQKRRALVRARMETGAPQLAYRREPERSAVGFFIAEVLSTSLEEGRCT